jgi:nicotinamide-nucleotide amidase
VAQEMANGVLLMVDRVDVAVATTGIAGPGGATPGKPVGMVCFGFAVRKGEGVVTRSATHIFPGDRAQVRHGAVEFALRGVLDMLRPAL